MYSDYSREQIHNILAPQVRFTRSTGQWGLQDIVPIHGRDGDFVFFVSFGRSQGDHEFDEDITTDGVLSWKSQPRQSLQSTVIQRLIAHDDLVNSIYYSIVAEAESSGATPQQTLSRVLEDLRDDGMISFLGSGEYVLDSLKTT